MESWGFDPIRKLPGQKEGMFFLGAVLGGLASFAGGALKGSPQQPLQFPMLKKNPAMALALVRSMMNAPQYDWNDLPAAPSTPGVPNFAAKLAAARG